MKEIKIRNHGNLSYLYVYELIDSEPIQSLRREDGYLWSVVISNDLWDSFIKSMYMVRDIINTGKIRPILL